MGNDVDIVRLGGSAAIHSSSMSAFLCGLGSSHRPSERWAVGSPGHRIRVIVLVPITNVHISSQVRRASEGFIFLKGLCSSSSYMVIVFQVNINLLLFFCRCHTGREFFVLVDSTI